MSLLRQLHLSAPAPKKVVLLPDQAFFLRVVPLTGGATAAEVRSQVELALEGLSPFPVTHLCHGYRHVPGAGRVLVYAAYRRRFTVEDAAAWSEAEAVLPAFAAWLGLPPSPPRAILVNGPDYVTALGWDGRAGVPAVAATRAVPAEAPAAEREAAKNELRALLQGFPAPVEVAAASGTTSRTGEDTLDFTGAAGTSHFTTEEVDALDVRDKEALAGRHRARGRDLLLWRIFAGCAAAIVVAGALELGIKAGRLWIQSQKIRIDAQAPAVQSIETKSNLANRVEELSTRRLMPIRMLELANEKRPRTIQFLRTVTKGLYGLEIEAQTNATPDVANYQAALKDLPACDHLEPGPTSDRGGVTRFTLTITFKPEALRPPEPSS
jgi:hypothetical protein